MSEARSHPTARALHTSSHVSWLCLSKAGVSVLRRAGAVPLSKGALALWFQLWGVPEMGLHHLGQILDSQDWVWESSLLGEEGGGGRKEGEGA